MLSCNRAWDLSYPEQESGALWCVHTCIDACVVAYIGQKEEMLKGEGRFVGSLGWRLLEGQVFEISGAACACLPAALCFGAN